MLQICLNITVKYVPMNNCELLNIQACSFLMYWNRGCTQSLVLSCKYWVSPPNTHYAWCWPMSWTIRTGRPIRTMFKSSRQLAWIATWEFLSHTLTNQGSFCAPFRISIRLISTSTPAALHTIQAARLGGLTSLMYRTRGIMMTSSKGNIFRVTGHLCGEFTGPRWIPRTKASDAELWCFLWSASE